MPCPTFSLAQPRRCKGLETAGAHIPTPTTIFLLFSFLLPFSSLFPLSPSLVSSTVPLLRTLQYLFAKEVPPTHPFIFIFGTNPGMAFVVPHTLCQQERVTFHLGLHWEEAEVRPEVLVSVW